MQWKKSQLSAKLEKFYANTESLRKYLKGEDRDHIWLQADQEFNQNEIAKINKKYNVLNYYSKLNDGHTVGAEQKLGKRLIKKGKLKPNEALKKTTNSINMLHTRKYGVPPEEVENKSLESEEYELDCNFKHLKKFDMDTVRYSRYDKKVEKRKSLVG